MDRNTWTASQLAHLHLAWHFYWLSEKIELAPKWKLGNHVSLQGFAVERSLGKVETIHIMKSWKYDHIDICTFFSWEGPKDLWHRGWASGRRPNMCEIAFHTAAQATVVAALLPTREPNYNAQLNKCSFLPTENRAEKTHMSTPQCDMVCAAYPDSTLLSLWNMLHVLMCETKWWIIWTLRCLNPRTHQDL